jgi:hypothetical protein
LSQSEEVAAQLSRLLNEGIVDSDSMRAKKKIKMTKIGLFDNNSTFLPLTTKKTSSTLITSIAASSSSTSVSPKSKAVSPEG